MTINEQQNEIAQHINSILQPYTWKIHPPTYYPPPADKTLVILTTTHNKHPGIHITITNTTINIIIMIYNHNWPYTDTDIQLTDPNCFQQTIAFIKPIIDKYTHALPSPPVTPLLSNPPQHPTNTENPTETKENASPGLP